MYSVDKHSPPLALAASLSLASPKGSIREADIRLPLHWWHQDPPFTHDAVDSHSCPLAQRHLYLVLTLTYSVDKDAPPLAAANSLRVDKPCLSRRDCEMRLPLHCGHQVPRLTPERFISHSWPRAHRNRYFVVDRMYSVDRHSPPILEACALSCSKPSTRRCVSPRRSAPHFWHQCPRLIFKGIAFHS